mgnify:FL=1
MCVAAPGKVIEIKDNTAVIDYNGNKVNANKGIVDVKVGDWALVHAGLIIQVISDDEAQNMIDIFNELGDLS